MREVFLDDDTIYAPITPNVHSAVSVIRVSGDKAIDGVDRIFKGKKSLKEVRTHTLVYGDIVDENGDRVDDVLVAVMRGPKSYTGEDVVEISCHGNPLIVGKIMELLKKQGFRMALPGEFTKRAVLNGKLDLIQAEAVNSLIMSKNISNLKISRHILDGALSEKISQVKENLLNLLAYLEVLVDHPEEDLANRDWEYIESSLKTSIQILEEIVEKSKSSKFFSEGLKICIAGKPNVGKSSLMNALLGQDRSIVSNIPGTTRDVVKEITSIEGVPVSLFDTAGIRIARNVIEREGIRRTIESIKSSDVIVLVFDISSKLSEGDKKVIDTIREFAKDKNVFIVFNKVDKVLEERFFEIEYEKGISDEKLLSKFRLDNYTSLLDGLEVVDIFFVSIKKMWGIRELAKSIIHRVIGDVNEEVNNILVNNERHRQLIEDTINALKESLESTYERMSEEFIAIGVRDALAYISEMIGEITTEDLMDRIFKNFCVGK